MKIVGIFDPKKIGEMENVITISDEAAYELERALTLQKIMESDLSAEDILKAMKGKWNDEI